MTKFDFKNLIGWRPIKELSQVKPQKSRIAPKSDQALLFSYSTTWTLLGEMPKRKRGVWKRSSCNPNRVPSSTAFVKPRDDEDAVSIWVQCESESCQKWRQISAEEAEGLGDSAWYCWLNRDTRYNNCSAVEQKAKKPKHMKFIYSLLPQGEVVMAKLSGYPP